MSSFSSTSDSDGSVSVSESSDSDVLSLDRHEHRHRHRGVRRHRHCNAEARDRDQFADLKTLLQIKLERFDGSYEKWPVFWAGFRSEIHNNPRLAKISRHRLLMQLLEGPAKDSMAAFVGFPQSYKEAIAQLKRSYNNLTAARDAIVQKFRGRPPMKQYTVGNLRMLLSSFDAVLAALRQLKLKDKSHEPKIAAAVKAQLPAELQLVLTRLPRKSLRSIRRALDAELRNLESSREMYLARSPPNPRAAAAPRMNRANNVAAVKVCVFCSADHRSATCPVYLTYQSRIDRVRQLGLCERCLHCGHLIAACPQRNIRCFGCGNGHFKYLCPNVPRREERPAAANVNCVRRNAAHRTTDVRWINTCTTKQRPRSPLLNTAGKTLLMTMLIDVCLGERSIRLRALLDSGADICLVSRRLCELAGMRLASAGLRRLIIAGGGTLANVIHHADVPIGPPGRLEVGRLRACMVDVITRPIEHVIGAFTRRILARKDIQVYDCLTTTEAKGTPIDVLIGMDALPSLFTDIQMGLTRHLSARKTIVGWCVAGVESFPSGAANAPVCMNVRAVEGDVDLSRLWIGEDLTTIEEAATSSILKEVQQTIAFHQHRYCIGLPWLREGRFDSNFANSLHQLRRLVDQSYSTELMKLIEEGHAERVPLTDAARAYYMPHRGV